MRRLVVKTLALALVLGIAGTALTQPPPGHPGQPPGQTRRPGMPPGGPPAGGMPGKKTAQKKSKLEEMLSEALRNNPDIRVAAAKLAMAEAEMNRTRVQATQEVIRFYNSLQVQEGEVNRWTTECERLKIAAGKGIVDAAVLAESQQQLKISKGKLAELEAQMAALLGRAARLESNPDAHVRQATLRATGPLAERMRKALQTPVSVNYKDMTFDTILKELSAVVGGLSFRNLSQRRGGLSEQKISLRFENLPVSAILQALADETECYFFVRDYGILATSGNHQPPGAMTIEEFLRHKPAEKK